MPPAPEPASTLFPKGRAKGESEKGSLGIPTQMCTPSVLSKERYRFKSCLAETVSSMKSNLPFTVANSAESVVTTMGSGAPGENFPEILNPANGSSFYILIVKILLVNNLCINYN
jgi:hypothetical protein